MDLSRNLDKSIELGAYAGKRSLQLKLVVVLMILSTLGSLDRQVMVLLITPIKQDLGLSDTQLSLLIGVSFGLAIILFSVPAGYLADRRNRRGIVAIGAVVWSFMTIFCGTTSNYLHLFLFRAGVGFGESVITPCSLSMIRDSAERDFRGRAFGIQSIGPMLGTALAMLIGGGLTAIVVHSGVDHLPLIGEVKPWQLVLIIIGFSGFPLVGLLLLVKEPGRPTVGATPHNPGLGETLRYMAARWRIYLPLFLFSAASAMVSQSYGAWAPAVIARKWGLSPAEIGVSFGLLMLICAPLGILATGAALDWRSRYSPVGIAQVGSVTTLLIWVTGTWMPLSQSVSAFWALFAVLLLVGGTGIAVSASLLAQVTPAPMMGRATGILYLFQGLMGLAVGPTIVAIVSDTLFQKTASALAQSLSFVSCIYGATAGTAIFILLRSKSYISIVKH